MREEVMIWVAKGVAHSLWQGLVIGLFAWVVLLGCRRYPGRQHRVLGVALVLLLVCLAANFVLLRPASNADVIEGASGAEPHAIAVPLTVAEAGGSIGFSLPPKRSQARKKRRWMHQCG